MDRAQKHLEFDIIKEKLKEFACSAAAKRRIDEMTPAAARDDAVRRQAETTSARNIVDSLGTPPLSSLEEIEKLLAETDIGGMLLPAQLTDIVYFVNTCRRMKAYLNKAHAFDFHVSGYGGSIDEMSDLYEEINRCIDGETVLSEASPALRDVRRRAEALNAQIRMKLNSLLMTKRTCFADSFVSQRNGLFVLPVKRECRAQVPGTLVELSGSGGTAFIAPASTVKMQGELNEARIEEDNEVRRILYTLTGLVSDCAQRLRLNIETMEALDFAFAKGRLSLSMRGVEPVLNEEGRMRIVRGRHPLIDPRRCVPLDFAIGGDTRGVVVTGPNTGGKTVALKVVGLTCMMAQAGLHVPADEGTEVCMRAAILTDIGDGQSISENLSTFSAHMTAIISVLERADASSLVLLDELGSGTDPAEGMGIAVAVLEELLRRGCLFLVTTHYPEIKQFAALNPGMCNARMAFDKATLEPLYRMELGEAGESCALYIAQRLGIKEGLLARARDAAYHEGWKRRAEIEAPEVAREAASQEKKPSSRAAKFALGDSVIVYPEGATGIVCGVADEKGSLTVIVRGKKRAINHKRVKLRVPASELYPPDYDFSVIFDTVENRKASHAMDKRHDPNLVVKITE